MTKFSIGYADWSKILTYAKLAHNGVFKHKEIGGMAVVQKDDRGDYRIIDPVILEQEISGGDCVLDKEALANYYTSMAQEHGADIQFLWWHSHGSGGAHMSSIDDRTIEEDGSSSHFSLSLVVTTKGTHELRVDTFNPIHMHETVPLNVIHENVDMGKLEDEVRTKCRERKISVSIGRNRNSQSLQDWWDEEKDRGVFPGGGEYAKWSIFKNTKHPVTAIMLAEEVDEKLELFCEGTMTYKGLNRYITKTNLSGKAAKAGIKFDLPSQASIASKVETGTLMAGLIIERLNVR